MPESSLVERESAPRHVETMSAPSTVELKRSLARPRSLISFALSLLVTLMTLVALWPLLSVIVMLAWRGGQRLSWALFTQLPPAAFESGGGIGNAILGTLMIVALAAMVSVPFGVLAAVFLAEIGPDSRLAQTVRFCAKMLTGFPSILAGVFIYGAVVLGAKAIGLGNHSALAGGLALSILMLPTVMLTAEEAIRMVPRKMRDASIGMGATSTQTLWHVLLPTALPSMLTGVMLAVARAAGETAPLLFTAQFRNYWPISNGRLEIMEPTASLAVLIYNFSKSPYDNQIEMAWAASLVLVLMVLTTNLIGQALSRRSIPR